VWAFDGQGGIVIPIGSRRPALCPFDGNVRNALNSLKLLLSKGGLAGSKVVLVKSVMLPKQHNAEKHRPAKPFGDYEVT
jgi:hypothetical protein